MDRRTLGKLPRGVASIKVSGATEVEVKEKKDRVDDAMWRHRGRWQRGADLHYRCTGQTAGEYADQKVRLEGRLCFRPSRCKPLKSRISCMPLLSTLHLIPEQIQSVRAAASTIV